MPQIINPSLIDNPSLAPGGQGRSVSTPRVAPIAAEGGIVNPPLAPETMERASAAPVRAPGPPAAEPVNPALAPRERPRGTANPALEPGGAGLELTNPSLEPAGEAPSSHYECSLAQADNRFDLEHGANAGDSDDLFGSPYAVRFANDTGPNSRWWGGSSCGLTIDQISAPGQTMTFVSAAVPQQMDT